MPKSVLSRRRSFVARLTALAMVASLMVIGAAPASAAVNTSDSCPATVPSAGFTDIGGFDATTQQAINCLAFYDITLGTSATTYSPNMDVTRWQMALFLTRQAVEHDVSLPSGAPQGFADIAGLEASTQIAINQLAQLEITQGTSATTFSPHDPVTRWQMALFLTRLLTAAGVTLPSGAPQGFTDLAGLSNEAQVAINQLAQLDVADGTSATTFSPFMNVNRWQMALFLTRVLAVDGVTPTALRVSITPNDAVTLNAGQARTYTAEFRNADGTAYTGRVGIEVLDTSAGAPVYNNPADTTYIEAASDGFVGGVGVVEINGFPGTDGKITFTVRNNGTAETVAIVAWQDTNADNGYSSGNVAPSEPSAVTAAQAFQSVAAGAAANGTYTAFVVGSTIKASDTFTASLAATTCGNGAGLACTFTYDANDIFQVDGSAVSLAGFEAALSQGDTVTMTYSATAANQSSFSLTDAVAALTVTAPSAAVTVDANTYTLTGRADPGATVRVWVDLNGDGTTAGAGEGVVTTAVASEDGAWSATVTLTQNAANNFLVAQVPVGGTVTAYQVVPTITEGANVAAKISSSAGANVLPGTAGVLDPNDTITIVFNEAVTGVGNGDTITLVDADGSTTTLTCGPDVTCSLSGDGLTLTLTINAIVFGTGGSPTSINPLAQITAVSGFQGADGLAINVAGSGAGRVFGGF